MTSGLEQQMEQVLAEIRAVRKAMEHRVELKTYSLQQTAQALGVGLTTVRKLLREGKLFTVKIGERRLVPVAEVNRLATPKQSPLKSSKPRVETNWRDEAAKLEAVIAAKRKRR